MDSFAVRALHTFASHFTRVTTYVTAHFFVLLFCAQSHFEKGSALKGKNLLAKGANSSLLE